MVRYCDICKEETDGPAEVLETPNFKWDLCLECFIDLEDKLVDIITKMEKRK